MKQYTKPTIEITTFDMEESIMQISPSNVNPNNITNELNTTNLIQF
jgi:hypothetical protein